uniref:Alternative protein n=1 Tax=Macrostomum lignano TaxID=282301 RepID=A0A1I8FQ74_9PLAT
MPAQRWQCARHRPICATKSCWCSLLTRWPRWPGWPRPCSTGWAAGWLSSGRVRPPAAQSRDCPGARSTF